MPNTEPQAVLYLRINRTVYRYKVFRNSIFVERQASGGVQQADNIQFPRGAWEMVYDGQVFDLEALSELTEAYEMEISGFTDLPED